MAKARAIVLHSYRTPTKKRTSIGQSTYSRPKNKAKRKQHTKSRGQGKA